MPLTTFTSGQILTATNMNQVARQAIIVCTSGTHPSSPDVGMYVHETDTDRLLVWNGSTWTRVGVGSGTGRTGCILTRTSTIIANASDTTLNFDGHSPDPENFYPGSGGTITVPTGCGGLYNITVQTNWSASVGSLGGSKVKLTRSGTTICEDAIPPGASAHTATFVSIPFNAAQTATIVVQQTSGASLNVTSTVWFYRASA